MSAPDSVRRVVKRFVTTREVNPLAERKKAG